MPHSTAHDLREAELVAEVADLRRQLKLHIDELRRQADDPMQAPHVNPMQASIIRRMDEMDDEANVLRARLEQRTEL